MQSQILDLETVATEDILRKNVKHEIAVDLDDMGIAAVARMRAAAEKKHAQLEQNFADLKTEWKEKLTESQAVIDTMTADIQRQKQDRVVQCTEVVKGNVVLIVRQDNNVVYNTRALAMHESQGKLPAVEGGNGVLAQAAAAQKANNSQEDDEGDVIADDGSEEAKPKKRKKS